MKRDTQRNQKLFVVIVAAIFFVVGVLFVTDVANALGTVVNFPDTANKTCADWYASDCKNGAQKPCKPRQSMTCKQTTDPVKATGICIKKECEAQTYNDPKGGTKQVADAMDFFTKALGLIQSLQGLMKKDDQKKEQPPVSPLPPGYPGGTCIASGNNYLHSAALVNFGCCGPNLLSRCVLGSPAQENASSTCPLVRMLCCGSQWLLATTTSSVCPVSSGGYVSPYMFSGSDLDGRYRDTAGDILKSVFNEPVKITQNVNTQGQNKVQDVAQDILDTVVRGTTKVIKTVSETSQPIIPTAEEVVRPDSGEVREGKTGVTIEVRAGDVGQNTEVAGFYGVQGDTSATQNTSVVGRLCLARPWANSFISRFISPSFFDGLCTRYGYNANVIQRSGENQVPVNTTKVSREALERAAAMRANADVVVKKERGITCLPGTVRDGNSTTLEWSCGKSKIAKTTGFTGASNVTKRSVTPKKDTVYGVECADGFTDTCEVNVIKPRATIWSEPKAVRLGARTVIYWNSQDVFDGSCTVRGPSFSETSASGGASTVPITGASTFTIACTAIDGVPVSESIIVDLAL